MKNGAAIAVLILVLLLMAVGQFIWPYKPCRKCEGTGRRFAPIARSAFRPCPQCKGSGRRERFLPWIAHYKQRRK